MQSVIIKGLLDEFQKEFSLEQCDEPTAFEHLVNHLVVSKIHPEAFDDPSKLLELNIDKGKNFGIDGVGVLVNGTLVTSKEELENFKNSWINDVNFVFTQSKTSEGFDAGDILKFKEGVKNFFSKSPTLPLSEELQLLKELKDSLFEYEYAKRFNNNSPRCNLYYATTGRNSSDDFLLQTARNAEQEITNTCTDFKDVKFHLVGSDFIIETQQEIDNSFEVVINFKEHIAFDKIEGVEQAYIGYLSSHEFLKLICDKEDNLRRNLFYENVRDFQGIDNSVNKEMAESIKDKELQEKFVLLNNGITIVTKSLRVVGGNEFAIRDFYIVNGCQTSNVIYNNRLGLKSKLKLPVKIISTTDKELISKIIQATNRQSPVPTEAFITLGKFHKDLQLFYSKIAREAPEEIFYERRAREYRNKDLNIEKARIFNLHSQIRTFASMFIDVPQDTHFKNPSKIYDEHNTEMFIDGHSFYPYYISCYASFKLNSLFNNRRIDEKYRIYRNFLIFGLKYLSNIITSQRLNSNEIEKQSKKFLTEVLWNDENCTKHFIEVTKYIDVAKESLSNNYSFNSRKIVQQVELKNALFTSIKGQSLVSPVSKIRVIPLVRKDF